MERYVQSSSSLPATVYEAAARSPQANGEQSWVETGRRPMIREMLARSRFKSVSLNRLNNTFAVFQADLDTIIEAKNVDSQPVTGWQRRSQELLKQAQKAAGDGNAELGWRCLKAADRFTLYGMDAEQLAIEAGSILAEATDEDKDLSNWRKVRVRELLCDQTRKLKKELRKSEVVRAKRIVDEHHDNIYQKAEILRRRLRILAAMCGIAVVAWLLLSPFAPYASSVTEATTRAPWLAWLGIVVAGVFGAILSGFASSTATDQKTTRIPLELAASTITVARFSIAMVGSLAAAILMASGLLNVPKQTQTYEIMLAVALAAGFSDRLVLRGIEKAAK